MSRPARYIIPAIFLSISVAFTGCETVYTDMYSPRRNHFVAVKEKPKPAAVETVIDTTPVPSNDLQNLGLPPAAPSSAPIEATPAPDAGAAPMIPGL